MGVRVLECPSKSQTNFLPKVLNPSNFHHFAAALDLHVVFHLLCAQSREASRGRFTFDLRDARTSSKLPANKTNRAAGVLWLLAVCFLLDKDIAQSFSETYELNPRPVL